MNSMLVWIWAIFPNFVLGIDPISFLSDYGYLESSSNAQLSYDLQHLAIRKFQRAYNLPITGILDRRSIEAMKQPRCGVTDYSTSTRTKRKSIFKWDTLNITYGVTDWTPDLEKGTVELLLRKAFDEYEKVTKLRFHRSAQPMINIKFALDSHQCRDFKSYELAHAFKPMPKEVEYGGDIHFNDIFKFTTAEYSTWKDTSLLSVATHEIGHALGLDHNMRESNSIMYYRDQTTKTELTEIDKWNLQAMYGQLDSGKIKKKPTAPKKTKKEDDRTKYHIDTIKPDACRTSIDAITSIRGDFYVFKDEWMWRISKKGELLVKPSLISLTFPNLPYPIDSAIDILGELWFFIGTNVHVMYVARSGLRRKHAPFKLTDLGIAETVNRIDMAYKWHYFDPPAYYLWSGDQYWKFDVKQRRVEQTYPRSVDHSWKNVPKNSQAAFTMNEELYFVKDAEVYQMNTSDWKLPVAKGFPQPIAHIWDGCKKDRVVYRHARSHFPVHKGSVPILPGFLSILLYSLSLFLFDMP